MTEKIGANHQKQRDWAIRRLEALDQIEIKLQQMRELAAYAAGRDLGAKASAEVQEWVDILLAEVNALDRATAEGNPEFSNLTIWQQIEKLPPH